MASCAVTSRLERVLSLLGWTALVCTSGCSETPYAFFESGQGGAPACTEAPCEDPPSSAGSGSNGSGGSGGASADACRVDDPALTPVRLELAGTGLCLASGMASILVSDPMYTTALVSCSSAREQVWTLRERGSDGFEVRNEGTEFNLDVQFAATDDGAPFILYEPHQLYNQRYYQRPVEGGTTLSPWHSPLKCLTNEHGQLQLWPCDPTKRQQTFSARSCAD